MSKGNDMTEEEKAKFRRDWKNAVYLVHKWANYKKIDLRKIKIAPLKGEK